MTSWIYWYPESPK